MREILKKKEHYLTINNELDEIKRVIDERTLKV
jgi:hypothetical protein